jgi:MOSC domain-containing protein YiiM
MAGEVVSIWLKRSKGGPMDPVPRVEAVAGKGLRNNANQGGKRQVTLIDEERWREAVDELGVDVPPAARRANVMLRGIDLEETQGRILRVGTCVIRIHNMTRPCEQMDDAQQGLREALGPRWRAGAYGEVIESGQIALGERAEWIESELKIEN